MTTRRFRQSEIKTFKTCPRQWWLQYQRGLQRKAVEGEKVSKASIGTLYHKALEIYYLHGEAEALEEVGSGRPWSTGDAEQDKSLNLVQRMVEGYIDWLKETGADANWYVEGCEVQLEVPWPDLIAGDEVILTGRIDMQVTDILAGGTKIVDNKSVMSFDQADLLYLNDQGRTYSWMMRELGLPVSGFIHNQARRVLRSKTATPPFYNRVEVNYSDKLLNMHAIHLQSTLRQMVEAAQKLEKDSNDRGWGVLHHRYTVPNPSNDCSWRCDFVHVCPMFDDGSDAEGWLAEFTEARENGG